MRAPPLLCVVCWLATRPCDRLRLRLSSAGVKDSELKKQLNKMMKEADAAKKAEVRASSQRPARIVRRSVLRPPSARSACSTHTRWCEQAKSAKAAATKKVDDEDLDPRMCAQLHQPADRPRTAARSG